MCVASYAKSPRYDEVDEQLRWRDLQARQKLLEVVRLGLVRYLGRWLKRRSRMVDTAVGWSRRLAWWSR